MSHQARATEASQWPHPGQRCQGPIGCQDGSRRRGRLRWQCYAAMGTSGEIGGEPR